MGKNTDTNNRTSRVDAKTNDPIKKGKSTMHKDSSGRLRDEKGHFIPNPNKPCSHGKGVKKTIKQKDDVNVVKIRIVKAAIPPPDKAFSGRLEDIKERTATNFIKSVCYHNPKTINIDGRRYYSQEYVNGIRSRMELEREFGGALSKALDETIESYKETAQELDITVKCKKKAEENLFVWKLIATVSISCLLTLVAILGIKTFCHAESESHVEDEQKQVMDAGKLK